MLDISASERLRIAAEVNLNEQYLYQCLTGRRPTPAEHCPGIERATAFAITCEELRPDLTWVRIDEEGWPEGKPLLDVAAQDAKAHA